MAFLHLIRFQTLALVAWACPAVSVALHPTWDVPGAPDACDGSRTSHPCGFRPLAGADAAHSEVYHAEPALGTYNHAVMMDFFDGFFLLTWKNAPRDEEEPGQRVLFSHSEDGADWTPTDGTNVLFNNISTTASPAHLFAAPSVIIEGRRYAVAATSQYSIHPSPMPETILMRRVYPNKTLGSVFWASENPPAQFLEGAALKGVKGIAQMDATTQDDVQLLWDRSYLPCGYDRSLKCEAVVGAGLPKHENTHWHIPNSQEEISMARHHGANHPFYWMHRDSLVGEWSGPLYDSNFPDVGSNLNAGLLPSGETFVLNNACPRRWNPHRNPLVISLSKDGFSFTKAWAITSCFNEHLDGCSPRYGGLHKNAGPAYPQGVTVVGSGSLDGLYVAFSNNKEDIWVVKVPYEALAVDTDGQVAEPEDEDGEDGSEWPNSSWKSGVECYIKDRLSRWSPDGFMYVDMSSIWDRVAQAFAGMYY